MPCIVPSPKLHNLTYMKRILLFMAVVAFPLISQAQNYSVGKSKDGLEEMFIKNVVKTSDGCIVSDRLKPLEGKLAEFREKAKKEAPKSVDKDDLNKLSYYTRRVKFNTKAKAYKVLEYTYYDVSGKEIHKVEIDEEDAKWFKVPAESLLEAEFKKVSGL